MLRADEGRQDMVALFKEEYTLATPSVIGILGD